METSKAEEYLRLCIETIGLADGITDGAYVTMFKEYSRRVVAETLEKVGEGDVSDDVRDNAAIDFCKNYFPELDDTTKECETFDAGIEWMRSILLPQLAKYKAELAQSQQENERLKEALTQIIDMANRGKVLTHIDSHVSAFARKALTTPNAE